MKLIMVDVKTFPKDLWEETQSIVEFIPSNDIPEDIQFTAVKVFLFDKNKLLLTKVPRGWDIPTGHKEEGEDLFNAIKRETLEETGVIVKQKKFIGYLKLTQIKQNEINKKYPPISAIAVFTCRDFTISDFTTPSHEATERCFYYINRVAEIHHRWSPLNESMMKYAYLTE